MLDLLHTQNGIPLIFTHKKTKTGHLVLHFAHGSASDPETLHGAVHMLEHMLFKGTQNRNYFELICGIEHLGADINAFTTKEHMVLHVSYPDESLDKIVEILADMVYNTVFSEPELKKEKQVIIDEIKSYRDTPAEFIYDEFEKMMYTGHPLSHPILGTVASVNRIGMTELQQVYEQVCGRFHFSVASSRKPEVICSIIEKHFTRKLKTTKIKSEVKNNSSIPVKSKTLTDDVSQSHIILGRPGPGYTDSEQLAAHLLASFLGGNAMSSILNLELREKKGITYTVETALQCYRDSGLFYTYFTCEKKRMNKTLQIVADIFENYRKNGLSPSEFDTLIRMTKSQYTMFFDHALNEAIYHAKHFQYTEKITAPAKLMAELDGLKLTQMNNVAAKLLDFDAFSKTIIEKE